MKCCEKLVSPAILLLALAVSIADTACAGQAAKLGKLNVCYSSIAATLITTWAPHEAGIFKNFALDVTVIYVIGAQAITTLLSGDAHHQPLWLACRSRFAQSRGSNWVSIRTRTSR